MWSASQASAILWTSASEEALMSAKAGAGRLARERRDFGSTLVNTERRILPRLPLSIESEGPPRRHVAPSPTAAWAISSLHAPNPACRGAFRPPSTPSRASKRSSKTLVKTEKKAS